GSRRSDRARCPPSRRRRAPRGETNRLRGTTDGAPTACPQRTRAPPKPRNRRTRAAPSRGAGGSAAHDAHAARHEVAHDALVGFTRRPALRALIVPYLALEPVGFGRTPQSRQVVVDVAQATDLLVVDRAGEDVAPGVDEAGGAERMASHRGLPRLEVLADAGKVGALEVPHRPERDAAEAGVVLDRVGEPFAVDPLAQPEVRVAQIVRRLVHD